MEAAAEMKFWKVLALEFVGFVGVEHALTHAR
jgi:hypothetical protein